MHARRAVSRPPHGGPRLAVSPGRRAPSARALEQAAVPRAGRGDRARQPRTSNSSASTARWLRYRLPARYVRRHQTTAVHRPEAALVSAAPATARRADSTSTHGRAGIRPRGAGCDYWEPVREVIYFKRAVYARALAELAPCLSARDSRRFRRGGPRSRRATRERGAAAPEAQSCARCRTCFRRTSRPPLVVRAYAPALRRSARPRRSLIGVLALYVMYRARRYNAGYDRQAAAQQRTELQVQIEQLEQGQPRDCALQLAELDTRARRPRARAGRGGARPSASCRRRWRASRRSWSSTAASWRRAPRRSGVRDPAVAHHRRPAAATHSRAPVAVALRACGRG